MHVPIRRFRRRAGVASVLAMMFLVIFGALAATMAVVAQGNILHNPQDHRDRHFVGHR